LKSLLFSHQDWITGVQHASVIAVMYRHIAESPLVEFVPVLEEVERLGRASKQA